MKNINLDKLVENGCISSYSYVTKDINGDIVTEPEGIRNTEALTLYFPNGKKVSFETMCSGSSEDTALFISLE